MLASVKICDYVADSLYRSPFTSTLVNIVLSIPYQNKLVFTDTNHIFKNIIFIEPQYHIYQIYYIYRIYRKYGADTALPRERCTHGVEGSRRAVGSTVCTERDLERRLEGFAKAALIFWEAGRSEEEEVPEGESSAIWGSREGKLAMNYCFLLLDGSTREAKLWKRF